MTGKLEQALNIASAGVLVGYGLSYIGRVGQLLLSEGSRSVQLVEVGQKLYSVANGSFGVFALIKLGRGETYCCKGKASPSRCHVLEINCAWGLLLGTSLLLPSKAGYWLEQSVHFMPLILAGDLVLAGHWKTLKNPRGWLLAVSQLATLNSLSPFPAAAWIGVVADTANITTAYSWASGRDDARRAALMKQPS